MRSCRGREFECREDEVIDVDAGNVEAATADIGTKAVPV
jgi:hypothetical protein